MCASKTCVTANRYFYYQSYFFAARQLICMKVVFSLVSVDKGSHVTITMMHWTSLYRHPLVAKTGCLFKLVDLKTSLYSPNWCWHLVAGYMWWTSGRYASYWNAFLFFHMPDFPIFYHFEYFTWLELCRVTVELGFDTEVKDLLLLFFWLEIIQQ